MKKSTSAFTIVELLIVIGVIAILAAISIVAYTGIQNRAYNSTIEADMAAIAKKMEIARVDLGHYPRSLADFPDDFKFSKSAYDQTAANIFYISALDDDIYAFGNRSKSGRSYVLATGRVVNAASTSAKGTGNAVGRVWTETGVNFRAHGYTGSPLAWTSGWSWTAD